VVKAIGAPTSLGSFSQFFWWFPQFLPVSRNVQIADIAAICWAIWKMRNKACFEQKLIKSPLELICYATVFMKYWAGLNSTSDQEALRSGADAILAVAMDVQRTNLVLENHLLEGIPQPNASHSN
jgi:hypothetical protein